MRVPVNVIIWVLLLVLGVNWCWYCWRWLGVGFRIAGNNGPAIPCICTLHHLFPTWNILGVSVSVNPMPESSTVGLLQEQKNRALAGDLRCISLC